MLDWYMPLGFDMDAYIHCPVLSQLHCISLPPNPWLHKHSNSVIFPRQLDKHPICYERKKDEVMSRLRLFASGVSAIFLENENLFHNS